MAYATGFVRGLETDVTGNTSATCNADLAVMSQDNTVGNNAVALLVNSTLDLTTVGLDGLDTGSLAASTWYYLFAVSNGLDVGVVASTSNSSPNNSIISSYPYYCRLPNTLRTNGSAHLIATIGRGTSNQYKVGGVNCSAYPNIATGAAGTFTTGVVTAWSSQSVTSLVPTPITSTIKILLEQGFNLSAYVSPNSSTAPSENGNSSNPAWGGCNGGNVGNQFQHVEFLLESSNVYYAALGTGSGIYCTGWEDYLGN